MPRRCSAAPAQPHRVHLPSSLTLDSGLTAWRSLLERASPLARMLMARRELRTLPLAMPLLVALLTLLLALGAQQLLTLAVFTPLSLLTELLALAVLLKMLMLLLKPVTLSRLTALQVLLALPGLLTLQAPLLVHKASVITRGLPSVPMSRAQRLRQTPGIQAAPGTAVARRLRPAPVVPAQEQAIVPVIE